MLAPQVVAVAFIVDVIVVVAEVIVVDEVAEQPFPSVTVTVDEAAVAGHRWRRAGHPLAQRGN